MCGISGFMHISGDYKSLNSFYDYFHRVNKVIQERGPDCFGRWTLDTEDKFYEYKVSKQDNGIFSISVGEDVSAKPLLTLCNFRGIPTTEYFQSSSKPEERIQPYRDKESKYIVTHNGQFSNDKELYKKHGWKSIMSSESDIDSYALVHILREVSIGGGTSSLLGSWLMELEGSLSIACYDRERSILYLARSFRGLNLAVWEKGSDRFLVWSSEEDSLRDKYSNSLITTREMPPYSVVSVPLGWTDTTKSRPASFILDLIESYSVSLEVVRPITEKSLRSLGNYTSCAVVLSGGMDSTVCAALACMEYTSIYLIHFQYGARAESREVQAVKDICQFLRERYPTKKISLHFIPLDFLKNLGGSTLTEHDKEIAQGELGVESAHEWVPARNTAMIGLAASFCDRHDIGHISLGLNMEEASTYRDNSIEFFSLLEKALNLGTMSRPKLSMPLGRLMKHHIWKRGREIGAPLHLSWSCYLGGDLSCGACGPCVMRQRAAAINGELDTLVMYKERDSGANAILYEKEAKC